MPQGFLLLWLGETQTTPIPGVRVMPTLLGFSRISDRSMKDRAGHHFLAGRTVTSVHHTFLFEPSTSSKTLPGFWNGFNTVTVPS